MRERSTAFVLVHSPLVGPATWFWVANALATAGYEVSIPDLRSAVMTGEPRALVTAVLEAAAGESPVALVGHSGAGVFLPVIAEQLEPLPRRIVFVDAGMPPCEGQTTAGGDFTDQLQILAVGGALPRWSTWWGDDVMATLVPDASRRALIEEEMPEVPLAFYESPVDLPDGWCDRGGSYLLLSVAYRHDANRARTLRWPVVERLGSHLDIVNEPDAIAHALIELGTAVAP